MKADNQNYKRPLTLLRKADVLYLGFSNKELVSSSRISMS